MGHRFTQEGVRIMAWPEASSWVLKGEEAADFLNRVFEEKPSRPLLKETNLSVSELALLAEEYVGSSEE
jgi:hypothetical protein